MMSNHIPHQGVLLCGHHFMNKGFMTLQYRIRIYFPLKLVLCIEGLRFILKISRIIFLGNRISLNTKFEMNIYGIIFMYKYLMFLVASDLVLCSKHEMIYYFNVTKCS